MRAQMTSMLVVCTAAACLSLLVADSVSASLILRGAPFAIGLEPWDAFDPFLFCAYHNDSYPEGHPGSLGPRDWYSLQNRTLGNDFSHRLGFSMYHGREAPGFPQHPHRGFETVTVAMTGIVDHFDSMGASGRYGHGDVQWMTAGRGVQHSEMFPLVNEDAPNPLELFQIWLNLPGAKKDADPFFEMFWAPDVPVVTPEAATNAEITVIAGRLGSTKEPKAPPPDSWAADARNEVAIWIVRIEVGGHVVLPSAKYGGEINRAVYVYNGTAAAVTLSSEGGGPAVDVAMKHAARIDASMAVTLRGSDGGSAEVLVLQGRPIKEKVVQHGPFVATSRDDLQSVIRRFQKTQFGGWPWATADYVNSGWKPRFVIRPGQKLAEYPPMAKSGDLTLLSRSSEEAATTDDTAAADEL